MTSTSSESSSFISTTGSTIPRGIIFTADCLTVKGTKDVLNKPFSFELSIGRDTMYFMAEFVEGERRLDQLHRMLNCAAFQPGPSIYQTFFLTTTPSTELSFAATLPSMTLSVIQR
ncbi:uncharacterized protein [Coffea arabica]|uniref:Protein kinase domain-containing protein n=1 Tax=Coffea arabica TaxID=13443 RepID=A0ABM4WNM2_COFAR